MTGARPDTWMPWYIGDYQRDTMHLDADQDGAYRRLLDACWVRHGLLPDDDAQFAVITKLGPKRWRSVRAVVERFFIVTAEGWRHKRIDAELEKAARIIEAKRRGGKTRAAMESRRSENGAFTQSHTRSPPSSPGLSAGDVLDPVLEEPTIPSPSPSSSLRSEELTPPLTTFANPPAGGCANGKDSTHGSARGSRLSEDWEPDAADREFAEGLGLCPDAVLAEFRDFWLAEPGARARKLDWSRTFRNRCRELAARKPRVASRSSPAEQRHDAARRILFDIAMQSDDRADGNEPTMRHH